MAAKFGIEEEFAIVGDLLKLIDKMWDSGTIEPKDKALDRLQEIAHTYHDEMRDAKVSRKAIVMVIARVLKETKLTPTQSAALEKFVGRLTNPRVASLMGRLARLQRLAR